MNYPWLGPTDEGISFSSLSQFLQCRERFRLKAIEGLREDLGWNHFIEYGSLFHEGLEAYAEHGPHWSLIDQRIDAYREVLINNYIANRTQINYWTKICKNQFRAYIEHWQKNDPAEKTRNYILQEEAFDYDYKLPGGRVVHLHGRFDSVFTPKTGSKAVYLQENKTKGKIDEDGIDRQLQDDLQSMIYCVALTDWLKQNKPDHKLAGIYYNIVRRPLGWGKNCIKKRVKESAAAFQDRLLELMRAESAFYFKRWNVVINDADLARFKKESLNPILTQLVNWWDSIQHNPHDPWSLPNGDINPHHFRRPLGVYDAMSDGMTGDYHNYLMTGSKTGLIQMERTEHV